MGNKSDISVFLHAWNMTLNPSHMKPLMTIYEWHLNIKLTSLLLLYLLNSKQKRKLIHYTKW